LEQIPELDSELNDEDTKEFQNAQQDSEPDTLTDSVLVHEAKSKSNKLQPGDICRVMSNIRGSVYGYRAYTVVHLLLYSSSYTVAACNYKVTVGQYVIRNVFKKPTVIFFIVPFSK
jgi:hypothetical protein